MGNTECMNKKQTNEVDHVQFSQSSKLKMFKQVDFLRYFNYLSPEEILDLDDQIVNVNLHELDHVF